MIMLILNHPLLLHLSSVVLGGRGTQKSEPCLPVGTVYLVVSRIYMYDQDCSLTVKCTFAINRKLIFFYFLLDEEEDDFEEGMLLYVVCDTHSCVNI